MLFKHKGLKRLYEEGDTSGVNPEHVEKIRRILTAMDAAPTLDDLRQPTFKLHQLSGNRKGQWAITVRANWRITFRYENGRAFDINYEDYHR